MGPCRATAKTECVDLVLSAEWADSGCSLHVRTDHATTIASSASVRTVERGYDEIFHSHTIAPLRDGLGVGRTPGSVAQAKFAIALFQI
jgi:hypothetical protein